MKCINQLLLTTSTSRLPDRNHVLFLSSEAVHRLRWEVFFQLPVKERGGGGKEEEGMWYFFQPAYWRGTLPFSYHGPTPFESPSQLLGRSHAKLPVPARPSTPFRNWRSRDVSLCKFAQKQPTCKRLKRITGKSTAACKSTGTSWRDYWKGEELSC